uniref:Insulin-like growth factor 1 receptor isoform X1 n=1 Tax=Diabrotica virgifera virgifera TaxID=50390 RepID=A0A6P7FHU7_DIAVI
MFRIVIFTFIVRFVFVDCEVCESMDIRNDPKRLKVLENCTEIWGSLQIVLFENDDYYGYFSEKDYENYVFPKLRVISGSLFMFNLTHLNSIGQLFPNLNQIQGRSLIHDYSLILYGNTQLKENGTLETRKVYRMRKH